MLWWHNEILIFYTSFNQWHHSFDLRLVCCLVIGWKNIRRSKFLPHWHLTFQYGPVIKLPLHISQCHMVNHMALTNPQWLQFWCNIFTSFLVNLLLDPIGMLIPWLKKSWITNPKLLTRALTVRFITGHWSYKGLLK